MSGNEAIARRIAFHARKHGTVLNADRVVFELDTLCKCAQEVCQACSPNGGHRVKKMRLRRFAQTERDLGDGLQVYDMESLLQYMSEV